MENSIDFWVMTVMAGIICWLGVISLKNFKDKRNTLKDFKARYLHNRHLAESIINIIFKVLSPRDMRTKEDAMELGKLRVEWGSLRDKKIFPVDEISNLTLRLLEIIPESELEAFVIQIRHSLEWGAFNYSKPKDIAGFITCWTNLNRYTFEWMNIDRKGEKYREIFFSKTSGAAIKAIYTS